MATISTAQLGALAQSGASNREIEAAIGHPMTVDERSTVDRARVVTRLRKQGRAAGVVVDAATRKQQQRIRERQIERREPEDRSRRRRLEKDPEAWLMHYCGKAMFPYDFSEGHKAIIRETIGAAATGTDCGATRRGQDNRTARRGCVSCGKKGGAIPCIGGLEAQRRQGRDAIVGSYAHRQRGVQGRLPRTDAAV